MSGKPDPSTSTGIFRKDGEYWTVGLGDNLLRLKDSKGFAYLAHLLRHPGTRFHVLDLVGGLATDHAHPASLRRAADLAAEGLHVGSLTDAGEVLDDKARLTYRRRLDELREELTGAEARGDVVEAEAAEREIAALTAELARAVGLRGRSRRAASASERARQTVTKTIKAVIARIAAADPQLGAVFTRGIRTGTYCSWEPDSASPSAWQFNKTDIAASRTEASVAPERGLVTPIAISPFSLAERTAFVGRQAEQATLRASLERALSGRGSLVMLGGGAGVGKSRLALETAQYASSLGFRFLAGHCHERDEPLPYLPFVEMVESKVAQAGSLAEVRSLLGQEAAEIARMVPSLRRRFPDIPEPEELPPSQQRCHLFQSVSDFLARAAANRPHLLLLDDMHWADEATLSLLIHLAERVGGWPVLLIGTYRQGYTAENPVLARSIEELLRIGIRPLKLHGLSRDDVGCMLERLSSRRPPEAVVTRIFEESGGNPFFVEEVYRHLAEEGRLFDDRGEFRPDIAVDEVDVPENVRLVIGRRLARLTEEDRQVLAAAAVIGRSFGFRLLGAVQTKLSIDELFAVLEKAQRMGLVVASSEGPETPFTFAHELVRQTLLADIATPRRQQLHAAVAEAIESLCASGVEARAGDIADHLAKAGPFADTAKLVQHLALAGQRALQAAAFDEAWRCFDSALSRDTTVTGVERAALLAARARAERGLGRREETLASLGEAVDLLVHHGERETAGGVFAEMAEALVWADRYEEADHVARRGLAFASPDDRAGRVRLLAAIGMSGAMGGAYQPAFEALREALVLAEQIAQPGFVTLVLATRSLLQLQHLRLDEALEDGRRGEKLGGAACSPWLRAWVLLGLRGNLEYLGRFEEAAAIADEVEPMAARLGQPASVAACLVARAWREFGRRPDLERLQAAMVQAHELTAPTGLPYWMSLSHVQLGSLAFLRGGEQASELHARLALQDGFRSNADGIAAGMGIRLAAWAGRRDEALDLIEQAKPRLPVEGQIANVGAWHLLVATVEALTLLDEKQEVARLHPLVVELVATGTVWLWLLPRFTRTVAGVSAAATRRWDEAEGHFRIAAEQAASLPCPIEHAEIDRFRAGMLLDRGGPGDADEAGRLLRRASDAYARLGMPRHRVLAQDLLSRIR